MSNIYVTEPAASGLITMHTSCGDIQIELWARECPKTVRNFLQLAAIGYYNSTCFHRLLPNFILQGGQRDFSAFKHEDSVSCALSQEERSMLEPVKVEPHSRLKFNRRGLLGMTTVAKEFFFTLAAAPELQGNNTIFGRVASSDPANKALYTMLELTSNVEVDAQDRPYPRRKVHGVSIHEHPFDDDAIIRDPKSAAPTLFARLNSQSQKTTKRRNKKNVRDKEEEEQQKEKKQSVTSTVVQSSLLSFDQDDDDDDDDDNNDQGDHANKRKCKDLIGQMREKLGGTSSYDLIGNGGKPQKNQKVEEVINKKSANQPDDVSIANQIEVKSEKCEEKKEITKQDDLQSTPGKQEIKQKESKKSEQEIDELSRNKEKVIKEKKKSIKAERREETFREKLNKSSETAEQQEVFLTNNAHIQQKRGSRDATAAGDNDELQARQLGKYESVRRAIRVVFANDDEEATEEDLPEELPEERQEQNHSLKPSGKSVAKRPNWWSVKLENDSAGIGMTKSSENAIDNADRPVLQQGGEEREQSNHHLEDEDLLRARGVISGSSNAAELTTVERLKPTAKDIWRENPDRYDLYDPRNPINKRKRQQHCEQTERHNSKYPGKFRRT